MKKLAWFERKFTFGSLQGMLPFYLERLEGTIARIESKVAGLPDDLLSQRLEGKWSIKENIAHLAEVDEIALTRIDEMVAGISPMSPAVIQPSRDYNKQAVGEVVEFFRHNRQRNLQKYSSLTGEDLAKSSLHPRLQVRMNPVDLAWFDAEHDDHHLSRISDIIAMTRSL